MRYLICKNNISNEEIVARMKYIYDIFHIYTFIDSKEPNRNIIALKSIPQNELDILMIVGHDPTTNGYVINNINKIKEKIIIIISCNTEKIKSLTSLKGKEIYIPSNEQIVNYYSGENIGFNFDIADEEIMLYRNRNIDWRKMITTTIEGGFIKRYEKYKKRI